MLTDKSGNCIRCSSHWKSLKVKGSPNVKGVCTATISGETLVVGEGYELVMLLQQCWLELTGI